MVAMDFPKTPTIGQTYRPANGKSYTWDGTVWTGQSGQAASFPDAPSDSKYYGRLNAAWGEVLPRTNPSVLGNMAVVGNVSSGGTVQAKSSSGGGVNVLPGDATHTGLVEFIDSTSTRKGYIGYADASLLLYYTDPALYPKFTGHKNGAIYNESSIWASDGNLYGTAWGAGGDWLSTNLNNRFAGKAGTDGSGAGNYFVQGTGWSNNHVYVGWFPASAGGPDQVCVQVDQTYFGPLIHVANFRSYFNLRRGSGVASASSGAGTLAAPAGNVVYAITMGGANFNTFQIGYTPIQYYWNGTWYSMG